MDGATQIVDFVLKGGTLIDGSGSKRRAADIAIKDERIHSIGEPHLRDVRANSTLDISGRIVAPGFIDVHTHDDNAVLTKPEMTAKISQGVTTVIGGNCGISLAPIQSLDPPAPLNLLGGRPAYRFETMAGYAEAVDAAKPAVNIALQVGHSTLRVGVVEDIRRKANPKEIDIMRLRLAEGLAAGAIGFSTGLWYKTNAPADMEEVCALAELLSDIGGIYTTHMRDEHDGVMDSLRESFETANRAQVPIVISHHKCAGPKNWGRSKETLELIDSARAKQPISLDAYPYVAGSTVLEPEMVDTEIRISVSWSVPYPEMAGRDLSDIAAEWGCSQQDAARRLKPAGAIYFQMDEADMRRILSYPATMIGSDGLPHDTHPHPRLWGTFPRVLGHFSRDEGLFGLEEAVHKMTGLSSQNFGLKERGRIVEGAYADIVVFDANTIIDRATFDDPKQPASGIDYVFVNGQIAWTSKGAGPVRTGRFLRRD
ncbi:MAG: amidohydrolase family protein [Rhizobiaceae bacterium]